MEQYTIKAPGIMDKKIVTMEITGKIIYLYIGKKRYKFLLHKNENNETVLTHYESGQKFGDLTQIKMWAIAFNGRRLSDREAAKRFVKLQVEKIGLGIVLSRLNSAPVIN